MGLNIAVTGYFGSGSSAVIDLLCEFDCNTTGLPRDIGAYEHTTLYHPGGLFDLEDKLLLGNDIHRSDEAIRTFKKEMMRLNDNNFGWFGSFQEMFGDRFEIIINNFISDIHPFDIEARYYGQYKAVKFSIIKVALQIAAKILYGRNIYKWGRQYVFEPKESKMISAFPSEAEFYNAASKYITSYMNLFAEEGKKNTIFDRLILCHNAYRVPHYFDDSFRLIVLNRDIRDVFVLNKYLWPEINAGTMYPTDVHVFIDYWRRLKSREKKIDDSRILEVNFEDLIYNYEDTVNIIKEHCNLSGEKWNQYKFFDPRKSIKNTQVYKIRDIWQDEIALIERELSEFIYNFPYKNDTSVNEMFDDSRVVRKHGLIQRLKGDK